MHFMRWYEKHYTYPFPKRQIMKWKVTCTMQGHIPFTLLNITYALVHTKSMMWSRKTFVVLFDNLVHTCKGPNSRFQKVIRMLLIKYLCSNKQVTKIIFTFTKQIRTQIIFIAIWISIPWTINTLLKNSYRIS